MEEYKIPKLELLFTPEMITSLVDSKYLVESREDEIIAEEELDALKMSLYRAIGELDDMSADVLSMRMRNYDWADIAEEKSIDIMRVLDIYSHTILILRANLKNLKK